MIGRLVLFCIWIVSCFYVHSQPTILNPESSRKDSLSLTLKKINEDLTDSLHGDYILIGGAFPYRGCYCYPKLDSIQMAQRLNSFFILKFNNNQLLLNDIIYTSGSFIINNTIICEKESALKITSLLQSINPNNIKSEKDIELYDDFICLIVKKRNTIRETIYRIDEKESKPNEDTSNLMDLFWILKDYKNLRTTKIHPPKLILPNKYPQIPQLKLEWKPDYHQFPRL